MEDRSPKSASTANIGLLPVLLLLSASAGCATHATTAPLLHCEPLAEVRADEGGTDRFGHLWLWDEGASTVTWLDADGELVQVVEIPQSRALAANHEWGIATLDQHGTTLRVSRPGDSEPSAELSLPRQVAAVAWIDRKRVAVAPTRADALVEVWDLDARERVASLGEGHEIETGPGATFLRSLRLVFDPSGNRVFTLDSLHGALRVLTLDGDLERQEALAADKVPELEEWRREVDRAARQRGATQTPIYWVLDLQVGSQGDAYVVERCSEKRDRMTWVRVSPAGSLQRVEQEMTPAVCSLDFARWRGQWVFMSNEDGDGPRAYICSETSQGDLS